MDKALELVRQIARFQLWSEHCSENGLDPDDGQGLDWLQAQDDTLESLIVQCRKIVGA